MNQALNLEASGIEDPIQQLQAENDVLLQSVEEQITLDTFDLENHSSRE